MVPAVTAGPVPLTKPQCIYHWANVKCVQANACPFRATNTPYTNGCPLENCHKRGPTQAPTAPTLTTNMSKNIEEAKETAPTLCHATPPVIFHQDAPEFLPGVLPRGYEWPALPARADTAHAAPALTKTAAPAPATPEVVGSGKRNSKCARATNSQTASPSPPVDQDSDITLAASIGESDGNSDYVDSAENLPTSPSNTPDLAGHISELEEIHEVVESKLVKIEHPTVIFSHSDKLELPELNDAKTNPPENHQENGATPLVNTQTSPPHSPLEDASVAPATPPPRPCVEAVDITLQA